MEFQCEDEGLQKSLKFRRSKSQCSEDVILFISGIPRFQNGRLSKKILLRVLKPWKVWKIVIEHNSDGHAKGYGFVYFSSMESALSAINNVVLPEELKTVQLSYTNDRKKSISFPFARMADKWDYLKLDPEAYYSITPGYSSEDICSVCTSILQVLLLSQRTEQSIDVRRRDRTVTHDKSLTVIDCTAGAGGNTSAFIQSNNYSHVIALELNEDRAVDLKHNLNILFGDSTISSPTTTSTSWEVHSTNCIHWLYKTTTTVYTDDAKNHMNDSHDISVVKDDFPQPSESLSSYTKLSSTTTNPTTTDATHENRSSRECDPKYSLLFFDPPWGGPNYLNDIKASGNLPYDYPLFCPPATSPPPPPPPPGTSYMGDDLLARSISLGDLLAVEIPFGFLRDQVCLVAIKVPDCFNATALFDRTTADDRPWTKATATSDSTGGASSSSSNINSESKVGDEALDERPHPFRLQIDTRIALLLIAYPPYAQNCNLDSIILSIKKFDISHGEEFHPKYYDWEKRSFVSLKRWKGYCGSHSAR